jgi:hypothetical protein
MPARSSFAPGRLWPVSLVDETGQPYLMKTELAVPFRRLITEDTVRHPVSTDSASVGISVISLRSWLERLLMSIPFWFAVGTLAATVMAWDSRHSMAPDGLSYLDMASETLRSGPHNLVNLLWSPLYPSLIALVLLLFHPLASIEIPLIHLLNWLIFVGVSLAFAFLVRTWFAEERDSAPQETNSARLGILVPFAFWLFFWSTIHFIPVSLVTPDLCVQGTVFLAAGICGQLARTSSSWKHDVALGGTLALGYYAKAAMFPLSLLLLLLLFLWPPIGSRRRYGVLLAAVVFLLVSAPLIVVMSSRVGHLSTGGSGTLNYAWWVNKVPPYGGSIRMGMAILDSLYTGKFSTSVTLTHPPRTLMEKPLILEFGSPMNGTYPLWYDPCYWNQGAEARFHLRQQLIALKENLLRYGHAFVEMGSLFGGLLVLGVLRLKGPIAPKPERRWYWLLLWPLGASAMYACVHVEYRFLGAFFVLFWLAAYHVMLSGTQKTTETAVLATVLCSLIVSTVGGGVLVHHYQTDDPRHPDYLAIADGLRKLGIKQGDQLATVGDAFEAYYARPAGIRVVAQIADADEFWSLSAAETEKVKEALGSIGVKALLAKESPYRLGDGWHEISGTRLNRVKVLLLEPQFHVLPPGAHRGGTSPLLDAVAPRPH